MPIRRTIKNVVKNYSTAEVKVREATSNDPWGPSSGLMAEIAHLSYDMVSFTEMMQIIWKRLNDSGKNWRHVYKTLLLLDYLLRAGSENVVRACRENIYTIQTLRDFQFVEDGKDYGLNVREKAKALTLLLKDDEQLKKERAKMSSKHHDRPAYASRDLESWGSHAGDGYNQSSHLAPNYPPTPRARSASLTEARPASPLDEERQLQMALAMSKQEHEAVVKREQTEEAKIALAIEASKQEYEQKHKHSTSQAHPPSAEQQAPRRGLPVDLLQVDDFDVSDFGYTQSLEMQLQDPWGAPARAQQQPPPTSNLAGISDPWPQNSSGAAAAAAASASSPWDLPPYEATTRPPAAVPPGYSSSAVNWNTSAAPASLFGNNGKTPLDDDFDVFSSRSVSASHTSQPVSSGNATSNKDPTLGILDLVDFDNLVSTPQTRTVNPYAMNRAPVSNPFTAPRDATTRMPMNAMAVSTQQQQLQQSAAPYQAYPSAGGMPPPLMPTSTPAGHNSSNPFL